MKVQEGFPEELGSKLGLGAWQHVDRREKLGKQGRSSRHVCPLLPGGASCDYLTSIVLALCPLSLLPSQVAVWLWLPRTPVLTR